MPSLVFRPKARPSLLWSLLLSAAAVNGLPSSSRPVASRAAFTRLGCYTDVPQRALTGGFKGDDAMTVEMCAEYCSPYQYFGVEYGRECYCGNTRNADSVVAPDADCSFACAGDATETCGAGMRLDFYSNDDYSTYDPSTSAPAGGEYLGCFVDNGARVLPENIISADDMTPAVCATNCAGYSYFGTQWSRECYCGNLAPTVAADPSDCNMPCAGDSAELCGAGMRLSVYQLGVAAPVNPDTVADFGYSGCYTDSVDVRTLPGSTVTSPDMTLTTCAALCADYHYFGLEDGDQCFCGMDLDPTTKTTESECQLKCAGDKSLVCGGTLRLTVYKKAEPPAPPSNPATVGAFSYQSCWTDSVGVRSLNGKSEMQADLTVETCAAFCDGYAYFGLEYSTECYCGDELAGEAAAEADCGMLCGGSASEWCGGPNRLNLYAVNPITPPTPSSTAAEVTATPSSTADEVTPTPTITPGPELTTVTSCSTSLADPSASCWWQLPSDCAALTTINAFVASNSVTACSSSIKPLGTSCFPTYFAFTNTASTVYNCLQTANVLCQYATGCATATYTVGQEPATTTSTAALVSPTVALQNPGFEAGSTAGWTMGQIMGPFNTQDVSTARAHSGGSAFRGIYTNDNGEGSVMSQKVAVVPGAKYTFSVWVSHDNTNSDCNVAVYANPYVNYAFVQTSLRTVPAGGWQQVSVNVQAAASWVTLSISFTCNVIGGVNSADGKDTLYIDDALLVRTDA